VSKLTSLGLSVNPISNGLKWFETHFDLYKIYSNSIYSDLGGVWYN
jgi:hypothetical protein